MRASALLSLAALALLAGCPEPVKVPEPPPPAPEIVAFSASPGELTAGESVTLSWNTKNASSVQISQSGFGTISGVSGPSGEVVVAVEDDALFVLVARNERGVEVSAATAVQVDEPASAMFVPSPERIDAGAPVTLAWSARGARTVALAEKDGAAIDIGSQLEVGSVMLHPVRTTAYVLTVDGIAHERTVTVGPYVSALVATPSAALPGEDLTISWQCSGATELSLSMVDGVNLLTETDSAKIADGSFTWAVPASIDPAGALSFVLSAKGPQGQTAEKQLTVYVAGEPVVVDFTVPAYGPIGGSYDVSWKTRGADQVEILQDGKVVYRSPGNYQFADQGMATFPTPPQDVVLMLRAINQRGGVAVSGPKTVSPIGLPSLTSFAASPQPGIQNGGEPVTLTWNVPNARHLKIIAEGQYTVTELFGPSAEAGSMVTYPNVDTTYRLEADNGIVGTIAPVTVQVTVATPAQLTLSPPTAPMGSLVQVSSHSIAGGGDVAGLPSVTPNAPGDSFVDISATGVDIDYAQGDTGSKIMILPEPFTTRLFGTTVSHNKLIISINGWFSFGGQYQASLDTPVALPSSQLTQNVIAPFFHDLDDTVTGEIFYKVDTAGGEKRLIVQWNKVEYDPVPGSELTFQAQLYESGKVVFAYKSVQAAGVGPAPSIGMQDGSMSVGLTAPSVVPADNSTLTLFGRNSLPASFKVIGTGALEARVFIGPDHFILIKQAYPIMPANQFKISEVNLNPAVAGGQWLELTNNTASAIDLQDWAIHDGAGGSHTISQSLILPANGRLLLAQSPNAADGVTADYVWGTSFALASTPDAEVNVGYYGSRYAPLRIPGNVLPGYALQLAGFPSDTTYRSAFGLTETLCTAPSTAAYGTHGQKGTPGQPNVACPSYTYGGLSTPGNFEAIAATGTRIVPGGTTNESIDEIQLIVPVRYAGMSFDKLWVGTNGFVSVKPTACQAPGFCFSNNSGGLPTEVRGLIAPFWDQLNSNLGGGIYWERKVPGVVPNDGYTIVSWENVNYNLVASSFNFQVKFFDTGNIEFHFGSMTSPPTGTNFARGGSATTWLQDPTGNTAIMVNWNTAFSPGIEPNSAYRFFVK